MDTPSELLAALIERVADERTSATEAIREIDEGYGDSIDWSAEPFATAYHVLHHFAADADIRAREPDSKPHSGSIRFQNAGEYAANPHPSQTSVVTILIATNVARDLIQAITLVYASAMIASVDTK